MRRPPRHVHRRDARLIGSVRLDRVDEPRPGGEFDRLYAVAGGVYDRYVRLHPVIDEIPVCVLMPLQARKPMFGRTPVAAIMISTSNRSPCGRGSLRGIDDLATMVQNERLRYAGAVRDVARIQLGPDERRGIAEMDGIGEVVGGIALKRDGADHHRQH